MALSRDIREKVVKAIAGGMLRRQPAHAACAFLFVIQHAEVSTFVLLAAYDAQMTALIVAITREAD